MADPRILFQPILYQAITPIHVGSGQDVGLVDLPVIRERTTDHPFLPGSGIRGALRSRCEQGSEPRAQRLTHRLFGNDNSGEISSGCVSILDAHLLLFPVRSEPGLFRWITCPFVLDRHRRLHTELCGGESPLPAPPSAPLADGTFLGADTSRVLYLEEYPFSPAPAPKKDSDGKPWLWTLELNDVDSEGVVLVSDTDFLHFVRTATVVRQRNRLTATKTVLKGHLFSVESLPAETWLMGFLGATEERAKPEGKAGVGSTAEGGDGATDDVEADDPMNPPAPMPKEVVAAKLRLLAAGREKCTETHLTLGGDESVGMGITRLRWEMP